MAGKAIVSSTCWDAFKKSPMSNDPETTDRDDRDLFMRPDRFVLEVLLLSMLLALPFTIVVVVFLSKRPASIIFSALVAKSLR